MLWRPIWQHGILCKRWQYRVILPVDYHNVSCSRLGGRHYMCTLRRCSALIFITAIFIAVISGCTVKKEEASYEERRHMPLSGELSMEAMAFMGVEQGSSDSTCFSYTSEGVQISLCADNRYEPAKVQIQGETYDFSFAGYSPQGTEPPEVCLIDINGDGILDVLLRGEAYRTEIRQDVYLSDGKGGYRELGDVTWRGWESLQKIPFSVTYEDGYRIHIEMPQYGIDSMEEMHTSFREMVWELGIYDEAGKVTEYGRTAWTIDTLQSQAVRYIEENDSITLRYEAQIASGYSEYGLGWCFVFLYDITDSGYVLTSVTLERFDY